MVATTFTWLGSRVVVVGEYKDMVESLVTENKI